MCLLCCYVSVCPSCRLCVCPVCCHVTVCVQCVTMSLCVSIVLPCLCVCPMCCHVSVCVQCVAMFLCNLSVCPMCCCVSVCISFNNEQALLLCVVLVSMYFPQEPCCSVWSWSAYISHKSPVALCGTGLLIFPTRPVALCGADLLVFPTTELLLSVVLICLHFPQQAMLLFVVQVSLYFPQQPCCFGWYWSACISHNSPVALCGTGLPVFPTTALNCSVWH